MSDISIHDNFLSKNEQHDILTYLQKPIFSGTQTSTGNTTSQRIFFRADLEKVDLFLELISKITPLLPQHNYKLVRSVFIINSNS